MASPQTEHGYAKHILPCTADWLQLVLGSSLSRETKLLAAILFARTSDTRPTFKAMAAILETDESGVEDIFYDLFWHGWYDNYAAADGEIYGMLLIPGAVDEEWIFQFLIPPEEHARFRGRQGIKRLPIPPKIRDTVFERDGCECQYCGTTDPPFELDHVLPHSRGGETSVENLVVSCRRCNRDKFTKTPDEWDGEVQGGQPTA